MFKLIGEHLISDKFQISSVIDRIITLEMFSQVTRLATRRAFSATAKQGGAHFKEGVYTNIPVKVHNRKIPYGIVHFGFFALGFAVPFISSYVQLKKFGAF